MTTTAMQIAEKTVWAQRVANAKDTGAGLYAPRFMLSSTSGAGTLRRVKQAAQPLFTPLPDPPVGWILGFVGLACKGQT